MPLRQLYLTCRYRKPISCPLGPSSTGHPPGRCAQCPKHALSDLWCDPRCSVMAIGARLGLATWIQRCLARNNVGPHAAPGIVLVDMMAGRERRLRVSPWRPACRPRASRPGVPTPLNVGYLRRHSVLAAVWRACNRRECRARRWWCRARGLDRQCRTDLYWDGGCSGQVGSC
jgi:hypothetical protein